MSSVDGRTCLKIQRNFWQRLRSTFGVGIFSLPFQYGRGLNTGMHESLIGTPLVYQFGQVCNWGMVFLLFLIILLYIYIYLIGVIL